MLNTVLKDWAQCMKAKQQNFIFFFIVSLLFFINFFNFQMIGVIKNALMIPVGFNQVPKLKLISIILFLASGYVILLLSRKANVMRAIKYFLLAFITLFALSAIFSYAMPVWFRQSSVIQTFYVLSNTTSLISIILVWGFINQKFTFKQAARTYPILGTVIIGIAIFYAPKFLNLSFNDTSEAAALFILSINYAIIFGLYYWANQKQPKASDEKHSMGWHYWIALAAVALFIKLADFFSSLAIKSKLTILSKEAFFNILKRDAQQTTTGLISLLIILLIIGYGFFIAYKGFKHFASIALVIFGIAFVIGIINFSPIIKNTPAEAELVWSMHGFQIVALLLSAGLFLKELAFLGIKPEYRFSIKVIIDTCVLSIMPLIQWLTATLSPNSLKANTLAFMIIFIVALIVVGAGFIWMNKQIRHAPLQQNK